MYDGLPSDSSYENKSSAVNDDASFLRNKPDIQTVPVCSNTNVVLDVDCEAESKPSVFEVSADKRNSGSAEEFINYISDDQEKSDQLLAEALSLIDNENVYKKPLGKSYKLARKVTSPVHSPTSSVSSFENRYHDDSDDDDDNMFDESYVTSVKPLIEIIDQRKDLIVSLVSDPKYSSEFHQRSERMNAFRRSPDLKTFEKFARTEQDIICKRLKEYFDNSPLLPYSTLVHHINFETLTEILTPDTIYDLRGKWPLSIKIRNFRDKYDLIRYVILPELFTEFLMEKNGTGYKDAAKDLYNGTLPTTHHVQMLLNDSVLNSLVIDGVKGNVTLQLVEGHISKQYTHGILNITDVHLMNNNEFSETLVDVGGVKVHDACNKYIQ